MCVCVCIHGWRRCVVAMASLEVDVMLTRFEQSDQPTACLARLVSKWRWVSQERSQYMYVKLVGIEMILYIPSLLTKRRVGGVWQKKWLQQICDRLYDIRVCIVYVNRDILSLVSANSWLHAVHNAPLLHKWTQFFLGTIDHKWPRRAAKNGCVGECTAKLRRRGHCGSGDRNLSVCHEGCGLLLLSLLLLLLLVVL